MENQDKEIEKEKDQIHPPIFDFYSKIKEIISQYESDLDKLDTKEESLIGQNANTSLEINNIISITLKKIIFAICCELSSLFMDNVFLISKLKFQNFSDNKSFAKVLEDILYQIAKQLNIFIFKSIINIFETLRLGNFDNDSMIFFIKIILTFYFEINFKKNFDIGLNDMKEMIRLIPLVELTLNEDENLIYTIMGIGSIPDKEKERPISTKSRNSSLPPVKSNKIKSLNITDGFKIPNPFKEEENKINNSLTDDFFKTQIK